MSTWKPYIADDVPLDLSTTADRQTQCSHSSEFYAPQYSVPTYYLPYGGYIAPVEHYSRGGSSSGYESIQFNPTMSVPTVPQQMTMFPPVTPIEVTASGPRHMADADTLFDGPNFQEYERKALGMIAGKNVGVLLSSNPRMRRQVRSAANNSGADDDYRRQRERNNEAAKKSRLRRKLREDHLTLTVDNLKKEMAALQVALRRNICVRCRQQCLC